MRVVDTSAMPKRLVGALTVYLCVALIVPVTVGTASSAIWVWRESYILALVVFAVVAVVAGLRLRAAKLRARGLEQFANLSHVLDIKVAFAAAERSGKTLFYAQAYRALQSIQTVLIKVSPRGGRLATVVADLEKGNAPHASLEVESFEVQVTAIDRPIINYTWIDMPGSMVTRDPLWATKYEKWPIELAQCDALMLGISAFGNDSDTYRRLLYDSLEQFVVAKVPSLKSPNLRNFSKTQEGQSPVEPLIVGIVILQARRPGSNLSLARSQARALKACAAEFARFTEVKIEVNIFECDALVGVDSDNRWFSAPSYEGVASPILWITAKAARAQRHRIGFRRLLDLRRPQKRK